MWHNVHSQQHTHMSSSYRTSRLGLSHWDPYTMHRGGCLELYVVTWWSGPGGIQALSKRPTGFLQCFDTVGLVIWPVKIVPEMTYNVSSGTLSLYTTTTTTINSMRQKHHVISRSGVVISITNCYMRFIFTLLYTYLADVTKAKQKKNRKKS